MKSELKTIIDSLPYTKPFLFVDTLLSISKDEVVGEYTFRKDEYFYEGHFKNNMRHGKGKLFYLNGENDGIFYFGNFN